MTCQLREESLNALVDEELHGFEKEELIAHLNDCAACQKERELLAALKKSVGAALPCPQTPSDLSAGLIQGALEIRHLRSREHRPQLRPSRPFSWGFGLAFAAALITCGWSFFQKLRTINEVSLDWILAAHNEYAMSLPLAQQELALPILQGKAARAGG